MTTSRKKQKPTTTNRSSLFRYGFLSIAVLGGIVIPILVTHLHVRLQQEHVHRNAHLSFAPITPNNKHHPKKIDTAKTIPSKDNTALNRQPKRTVITGTIHDILHPAGTTTNTNTANLHNTTRRSNKDNTSDTTYDPLAFGRIVTTEEHHDTSRMTTSPKRYTVVMSFVDESYFPVFELWLQYYQQLGPIHAARRVLCFVALSDATYRRLQQFFGTVEDDAVPALGKTIVLVQPETDFPVTKTARSMLWIYRVRILDDVLRTYPQFDVVLTDLDALWLRDPHDLFHTPSGGGRRLDIVASQAEYPRRCKLLRQAGVHHQLPTPEHNQRFIDTGGPDGGAAVLGFIYFGNTAETRGLVQRLVDQTTDTTKHRDKPNFDDQFEFNCLLYHQYNLRSTTQLFRSSDRNKTSIDNNTTNTNTEEEDGSYLLQYTHKAQNKKNNQPASTADNGPTTLSVRLLTGSQVLRYCDRKKERGGGGITKSTYVVHCYNKGRDYETIVNVLNHTVGFATRMQ